MMRKSVLMIAMLLMPMICLAQEAGGQVRKPVKKQTTTMPEKQASTAEPIKKKDIPEPKPSPKPAEPTGYDVSFSCNVSSATLYIDGTSYGLVSGTRFLKTGSHSIKLEADGYEPLTNNITVNSANTWFSFTMKENVLKKIVNNIINNMVYVEGGTFMMGATAEQKSDADKNEKPVHQVTLSSFSIGKYEVTQEEWEAVMGSNPSDFKGKKKPVENVSWEDCQEFIRKLNSITGKNFRLPTEAEWEFAARGGNKSKGYKYAGSNTIDDVAWYRDNSDDHPHNVGTKSPNELGLYDMSGNVGEWCLDWYGKYSRSGQTNPIGSNRYGTRVFRGSAWWYFLDLATFFRVSCRHASTPSDRSDNVGLRLAL